MENDNPTAPEPLLEQPEKYRVVKLIFYFVLGASGVFWAILAALWIKFRTRQNKRPKFIAVGGGLLFFVVSTYGVSIYTHAKNPELKIVENVINQQYQNGSASAGIHWAKEWTSSEEAVTTNTLVVGFKSRKMISGDTMMGIGRSTCSALGAENTKYDLIGVANLVSPIYPLPIPFRYDFSVSNSCSNWLNDQKFEQSIKGFRQ
ncbi:MAG: hypothetical protein UW27_C0017G0076 [Parcubacteria group bacterium GW2011_GWA1_44_13]|uniref:Uncharacterized protein n=1 Tax=Candidatus Nomurabacteria bacterium GW2011_GWB1_44_12 TaxID=1618748 RepID=A0A837IAR1_9BACT|nr:MAG: hypothetical protein UW17_C0005G0001 [Candidatus Nomurabacteria bacterium GW2011_GWD1_44_10]KKT36766.1 MAG: hypothetical protein UW25_C0004G0094 [Candidatus Nomurabacteria bacterium GW2011_GWB1_44_12]KKT37459.1 MAG: hypothetical protein UW27_C0017G0076 [Parcubacteria group bacterium GW2011_GWA1_44_13]KKT59386.1 MAG: hypothetical protein UW54_C0027G0008 [Parcubacteria group bacterium GW2011_GWC1_44_26]HBB43878.1 hypothetical protein [Candidatus Yonathbacteria bacterium]